jgi:O-glycosyl hydrolase
VSACDNISAYILKTKQMIRLIVRGAASLLFFVCLFSAVHAQVQFAPWGNMEGIRIDGQLLRFGTAIRLVEEGGTIKATAKERGRPSFKRNGASRTVASHIDSLYFTETASDGKRGTAHLSIRLYTTAAMDVEGVYFCIMLPRADYRSGRLNAGTLQPVPLSGKSGLLSRYLSRPAKSFSFLSPSHQLTLTFDEPVRLALPQHNSQRDSNDMVLMAPLLKGRIDSGTATALECSFAVSGKIDTRPVTLMLDTSHPGRVFDGIGGNFRLQNPREDSKVIDYCLGNMRVAWGRVELPWSMWQPNMNMDPIAAAKAGKLNIHVKKSMEMAQRLYKRGIPLILSAWFPPGWAVVGKPRSGQGKDGIWGNPLDPTKMKQIYRSIADYLVYLRDAYGVEVRDFSFNESDLGINVRQTAGEHDALIRGLGAYFRSRGLKTKLLLGDNSDATTYRFIYPALHDSAARPYIGAVSFHSWRGCDSSNLKKWAAAATLLHKPLIVAEGSIDAQAWGYPEVFQEPSYALKEISLYLRLLAICQPESILQWQLTSDYSLLAGGGLYGNNEPLHPTQRFWNLKQLASTPPGLHVLPLSVKGNYISAAALGDTRRGIYAIHLVNNGAARKVMLEGLPAGMRALDIWVTAKDRDMQPGKPVVVKNGRAVFFLPQTSYTTLISR